MLRFRYLLTALALAGCTSAPMKHFSTVDRVEIEIPFTVNKEAVSLTGKGKLKFAKATLDNDGAKNAMSWTCTVAVTLKPVGNSTLLGQRILEKVRAEGLSLPKRGDLFMKSPIGKKESNGKPFTFRLDDLLGTYQIENLSGGGTAFFNPSGLYFSSFVQTAKGLGDTALEVSIDKTTEAEDFKNVFCAEIREGIEFHPKTPLVAPPDTK